MLLKLVLEYDGSDFYGWARQPGRRTLEGVLGTALDAVYPGWGRLAVAGRTDAGVHATGQVASVEATAGPPAGHAVGALNAALPRDVAVVAAEDAPAGFNARFSAVSRSYRYVVLTRGARSPLHETRSLWWPRPVESAALAQAAGLLVGEHDFTAFTPTESRHHSFRRTVRAAAWERHGDQLHFTITADSFLRHMVRTLVGTMLELGVDAPVQLPPLLAGRPRSDAGRTAPACGLYLERVGYSPEPGDQSTGSEASARNVGVGR